MSQEPSSAARLTPKPWPPNVMPTDEEFAAWLAVCTQEERVAFVESARCHQETSQRCLMENHVNRLASIDLRPGNGKHRAG